MARANFGATAADYLMTVGPAGQVRVTPGTLTMWSAETGGTQYADLLLNGAPVSSIPVARDGQVPLFQGPDGVGTLWADGGGAERVRLLSDKTGEALESDEFIATQINTPGTATETALEGKIAEAIAGDPTVVAAATAAVEEAAGDLRLSYTLIEESHDHLAFTTLRGTPTYVTGKWGNGVQGGVLQALDVLPTALEGDWTVEFWMKRTAAHPSANNALISTPFGWIGTVAGGGQVFWHQGSVPTNNPVVTDNLWHHIACVVAINPGAHRKRFGLYIDGVRTTPTATPTEVANTTWSKNIEVLGLAPSGFDDAAAIVDDVRISFAAGSYATEAGTKARYTGSSFAVPTGPHPWDDTTVALARLDSSAPASDVVAYPPRPTGVPGGAVTYMGLTEPTDMLARDRWVQA